MKKLVFLLSVMVGPCIPDGYGGWGDSGCVPVGTLAMPTLAQGWHKTQGVNEYGFWVDGVQVGSVDGATGEYYRRITPGVWSGPCDPLCQPPVGVHKVTRCGCTLECKCDDGKCKCRSNSRCAAGCKCGTVKNYGVEWDRIGDREKYTVNGHEVVEAEVNRVIGGKQDAIPDDSTKNSITLIGSKEDCKRALGEMPVGFRNSVIVQEYSPDDPMIKCGFKTGGNPTIYFQQPDGKVLFRVDDYRGAESWGVIRKADPNYKPELDPIPGSISSLGVNHDLVIPGILGIAVMVVLGMNIVKKAR